MDSVGWRDDRYKREFRQIFPFSFHHLCGSLSLLSCNNSTSAYAAMSVTQIVRCYEMHDHKLTNNYFQISGELLGLEDSVHT